MKILISSILLFFFGFVSSLVAQSSTDSPILLNFEKLDNADKFLMYIDTISEYMYRDGQVVDHLISECEEIIKRNTQLSNTLILRYTIQKIYYELNNNNLLSCYQIIKEQEHLLLDKSISDKVKGSFNYIRGFSIMALGDISSAQEIYYDLLQDGRSRKDTSLIVNSLYSLGQLYADEQDYNSAIQYFLSLIELRKIYKDRPSNRVLIDFELSETYMAAGQNEKALEVIKSGLLYLDQENLDRLKPDFLILKGHIALEKNDLSTANKTYQEIIQLTLDNVDPITKENTTIFYAKLLEYQGDLKAALKVHESLLIQLDSTKLSRQHATLKKAHKVAYKMGNISKAYQFLTKQNEVNEKITKKKKEQETAYLKIKFESAQKEQENQQLALDVLKEQNQNRLLYFFLGSFLLGILMLFIAFNQKKKHSQNLQEEVNKQTYELQVSNTQLSKKNKELYQFSFICSHDLKEPVQTIGTYTQVIEKEIRKANLSQDYTTFFHFINKSVTRLSNLLEQIRIYFDINNDKNLAYETVSINEVFQITKKELAVLIDSKNALVTLDNQLASDYISYPKIGLMLILKNLVQNSLQFNESDQPLVKVCFTKNGEKYILRVEDNGIGIEEEYFDYVFEPFKTLGSRQVYNSAGLGLSICRKIIRSLGGTISISSKNGTGTVFNVTFK